MPEPSMLTITASIIVVHPTMPKLLCVRHPSLDAWMFPGGRVEADEAPHKAALREIREEVGLSIMLIDLSELPRWCRHGNSRLPQPIAMIQESLPDSEGSYVDVIYVGVAADIALQMRNEITEAGWFDQRTLNRLWTPFPIKELAAEVFERLPELRQQ